MPEDFYISPRHLASSLKSGDVDEAIAVFEAAVRGWMLDHANDLARPEYAASQHAGFAILLLISSYFEAIEPYFSGSSVTKSSEKWRAGFRRVFPEALAYPDEIIDRIYGELRCGLYHSLSAGSVQLSPSGPALVISADSSTGSFQAACINPWKMLQRVDEHFKGYIADLKDLGKTALRQSFSSRYRTFPFHSGFTVSARSSWP